MNWKASVAFNLDRFSRMKDFTRLQAVTHTVKMVVSKKWCKYIDTLLLHIAQGSAMWPIDSCNFQ